MSIPETECPHLDVQEIHTYGWKTVYCADCDTQWQTPTKTQAEVAAREKAGCTGSVDGECCDRPAHPDCALAGPYTEETE